MKKRKQNGFTVLIAVITMAVMALAACGKENEDKVSGNGDPQCECPAGTAHTDAEYACEANDCNCTYEPKCKCTDEQKAAHYLPCECGTNDCACVVVPRGYITDDFTPSLNIPIYQKISDNTVAAAEVDNIKAAFDLTNPMNKYWLSIATNFNEIWITDEKVSFDAVNGILKISPGWDSMEIAVLFVLEVIPKLEYE